MRGSKVRRAVWLSPVSELEGVIGDEASEVRGDRPFRMSPHLACQRTGVEAFHPRSSLGSDSLGRGPGQVEQEHKAFCLGFCMKNTACLAAARDARSVRS